MQSTVTKAPASMTVSRLTASIGAEVSGVDLGAVARSDELFAELKSLLLAHKVLFFRDQDITRAEHVQLARRFGPLEDHPVAPSDPDHAGLVRIYKDLDSPPEHYENAYHCDGTWKETPPLGCVLRCVEAPPVGGDTIWVLTCSARFAYAAAMFTQMVSPPTFGVSTQRSTQPNGGFSRQVASQW